MRQIAGQDQAVGGIDCAVGVEVGVLHRFITAQLRHMCTEKHVVDRRHIAVAVNIAEIMIGLFGGDVDRDGLFYGICCASCTDGYDRCARLVRRDQSFRSDSGYIGVGGLIGIGIKRVERRNKFGGAVACVGFQGDLLVGERQR